MTFKNIGPMSTKIDTKHPWMFALEFTAASAVFQPFDDTHPWMNGNKVRQYLSKWR